eukprot:TRINITY_DN16439_c0_g1_i2.p1 TRINITY_DN16439_c0_g1~~TRINITY_DN16439_c0_g1_i2.p1  ORF type:complete len:223 (+),score=51.23 TRINITY_DN16439_c0_g1_i2:260-928(+)
MKHMLQRFHTAPPTAEELRPCAYSTGFWWQGDTEPNVVRRSGTIADVQRQSGKLLLEERRLTQPLYRQCADEQAVLQRVQQLEEEVTMLKQQLIRGGLASETSGDEAVNPTGVREKKHRREKKERRRKKDKKKKKASSGGSDSETTETTELTMESVADLPTHFQVQHETAGAPLMDTVCHLGGDEPEVMPSPRLDETAQFGVFDEVAFEMCNNDMNFDDFMS